MNGAAEVLLADILAAIQVSNARLASLINQNRQMIGTGSGGTSNNLNNLSASSGGAAKSLGTLGKAAEVTSRALQVGFNMLSGVISGITTIVGSAIGVFSNLVTNLYSFAKQAALGEGKLSDFYQVFKDLPIFGRLFRLLAEMYSYQERLLAGYQDMTKNGASFTGSLQGMIQMAARAYLSLDEFQRVVKENASSLALAGGGNIDRGMQIFINAQRRLLNPDGEFGRAILGLGVTAEESAQYIAGMINMQQRYVRDGTISTENVAKSTKAYIEELDVLAKLTGKRRDQIDKEVQEAENEQLLATFIDNLSPDEQTKARMALAAAAPFGKAAVQEIGARLRGLDTPVSDVGTKMAIFSNGVSLQGETLRRALSDTSVSAKDMARITLQQQANIARNMGQIINQVGPLGAAAGILKDMPQSYIQLNRTIQKQGLDKILDDILKKQKAQIDGSAGAFAAAQLRIREFGMYLADMFFNFIKPLEPMLKELASALINLVTKILPILSEILGKMVKWFSDVFKDLAQSKNPNELVEKILKHTGEGIKNVWQFLEPIWTTSIKPAMMKMFQDTTEFLKPYFIQMTHYVIDTINAWAYSNPLLKGLPGVEDPALRERKRAKEYAESDFRLRNRQYESMQGHSSSLTPSQVESLIKERNEAQERLRAAEAALNAYRPNAGKPPAFAPSDSPFAVRHSGTIGMTGRWWELETGPKLIQEGETVLTQGQLAQIVDTAGQNYLSDGIRQLNSNVAQLIQVAKQTAENTRRNIDAVKALNGDLFQVA